MTTPKACLERVYDHFGLDIGPDFSERLNAQLEQARDYKSRHGNSMDQFGIDEEWIYERLQPIFDTYGFER